MNGFLEIRETLNAKGQLVSVKDYKEVFNGRFQKSPKSDWYRSLFVYNPEIENHFKEKNSVGGFKGEVDAGYLFFDLDNKDDLEKAKSDTRELLTRLSKLTKLKASDLVNHIEVYFSGNKGFHVFLYTEQRFTPEIMKKLCKSIANGISSFDEQIYNTTRIIRIENTIHHKSGLYKIQVNPLELSKLTIEELKKLAEKSQSIQSHSSRFNFSTFSSLLEEPKKPQLSVVVDSDETDEGMRGISTVDFSKCPKNWPRCIYAMTKGLMLPGKGERHYIYLTLARFFKNQGMDAELIHNQLKAIARLNYRLYPESDLYEKEVIWNECVKSVFDSDKDDKFFNKGGWGIDPKKDEVFKKYCKMIDAHTNSKCCMHDSKRIKKFFTSEEVLTNYKKFAKDFKKNIVKTGMNFIDEELEIRKKTVTLVVGSAGSGKTTLALKVLENSNKLNINSVFFSMDMDPDSIFEKLAEKHTDYSRHQIRKVLNKEQNNVSLVSDELKILNDCTSVMSKFYAKTQFDFTGSLTMDQMQERIIEWEESTGEKIGLVLVDYAGRISSEYKDSYANDKYNALRSKDVASTTDSAWIILCQTSRNSGDSFIPLRTKRAAKGAGDWEEAAQNVITVWRPFAGMDGRIDDSGNEYKDDVMRVYLAKNRMGKEKEIILHWNPAEGILEQFSQSDLNSYQQNTEPLEKSVMQFRNGKKFGSKE